MAVTVDIKIKPTYDLQHFDLKYFDNENQICYFQSKEVFKFDKVYGMLNNRSRVTRINKSESTLIEQIISATIDAGYNGKLAWKTKLTKRGIIVLNEIERSGNYEDLKLFTDCQQIHLFPYPFNNYYDGTNQTELEADVIFTV